jgi:hypothetical protein
MGLLDEAIRDHLELKRRSGADPTAVERDELEALAPVLPGEESELDGDYSGLEQEQDVGAAHGDTVPVAAYQGGDAKLADFEGAGQDTAELDMQAVLNEDLKVAEAVSPVGPVGGAMRPAYHEKTLAEEALEWEQSDAPDGESAPADIPGQERLSFE